jgi:hypothetical protein
MNGKGRSKRSVAALSVAACVLLVATLAVAGPPRPDPQPGMFDPAPALRWVSDKTRTSLAREQFLTRQRGVAFKDRGKVLDVRKTAFGLLTVCDIETTMADVTIDVSEEQAAKLEVGSVVRFQGTIESISWKQYVPLVGSGLASRFSIRLKDATLTSKD